MTPLKILKAARALIEKPENWGQGPRINGRGYCTFCTAEAVEDAAAPFRLAERRCAFESFFFAAGLEWKNGAIVKWNDAPDRTHSEVLATFNLAIALERNMPRSRRSAP